MERIASPPSRGRPWLADTDDPRRGHRPNARVRGATRWGDLCGGAATASTEEVAVEDVYGAGRRSRCGLHLGMAIVPAPRLPSLPPARCGSGAASSPRRVSTSGTSGTSPAGHRRSSPEGSTDDLRPAVDTWQKWECPATRITIRGAAPDPVANRQPATGRPDHGSHTHHPTGHWSPRWHTAKTPWGPPPRFSRSPEDRSFLPIGAHCARTGRPARDSRWCAP